MSALLLPGSEPERDRSAHQRLRCAGAAIERHDRANQAAGDLDQLDHALADLLFGDADFAGRLPFVIPTDEAHLPHWDIEARAVTYDLWHGHAKLRRDHHEPAFPFGFGLSYGTCKIVSAKIIDEETVECRVANTGERNTSTIVQVYGGVPGSAFERIERRLLGFARVDVLAGATTSQDVRIERRLLDVRVDGAWIREDRPIRLWIGQCAYDEASITVTASSS